MQKNTSTAVLIFNSTLIYVFMTRLTALRIEGEEGAQRGAEPCSGQGCNDPDPAMQAPRGDAGEEGADIAAQRHARAVAEQEAADDRCRQRAQADPPAGPEASSKAGGEESTQNERDVHQRHRIVIQWAMQEIDAGGVAPIGPEEGIIDTQIVDHE